MKLHLDAAEFVRVDLFIGFAHDDGGLRTLNQRLRGDARGPELLLGRNGGETAAEEFLRVAAGGVEFAHAHMQRRAGDEIIALLIFARMLFKFELAPGAYSTNRSLGPENFML